MHRKTHHGLNVDQWRFANDERRPDVPSTFLLQSFMSTSCCDACASPYQSSYSATLNTAARAFASDMSPGENVVVPLIANSLEWALSSPPPLHQFTEPPLVVETDHLDINPGKEVEEILAAQGHEVTDIIGKEKWVLNDPALYEGLIPQNEEWTEFVDEKTGEWVTLDEYGQRVSSK
jgi:hypothetical protein